MTWVPPKELCYAWDVSIGLPGKWEKAPRLHMWEASWWLVYI